MAKTLVDTNVLVAYFNTDDVLHERAVKVLTACEDMLITDYVFDELTNVLTRRQDKTHAKKAGEALLSTLHSFTYVSAAEFLVAWQMYTGRNTLSFTDCTNLAVMQTFNITQIATFDQEFEKQPGITVLK